MSKLSARGFTVSIDGFGAGPEQDLENPMGKGSGNLHQWAMSTRTFQKMHFGNEDGTTGVDEDFVVRGFENVGAWIMGRNMFGPIRGEWDDGTWKGWWGDNPPYRVPVFVLTHYPREPLEMEGGTIFHFVTEGIEAAFKRAKEAAAGRDIRVGGGVETVRQYVQAGLMDEMHLAISPVLLGRGENLFQGIDLAELGFQVTEHVPSEKATHIVLTRR